MKKISLIIGLLAIFSTTNAQLFRSSKEEIKMVVLSSDSLIKFSNSYNNSKNTVNSIWFTVDSATTGASANIMVKNANTYCNWAVPNGGNYTFNIEACTKADVDTTYATSSDYQAFDSLGIWFFDVRDTVYIGKTDR